MDIKSKRYSIWLKGFAFVLAVSVVCGMVLAFLHGGFGTFDRLWAYNAPNYEASWDYSNDVGNLCTQMGTVLWYRNEPYIWAGSFVDQREVDNRTRNLYDNVYSELHQKLAFDGISQETITEKMLWDTFQETYWEEIEKIRTYIIQSQVSEYQDALASFTQRTDIVYSLMVDGHWITNTELRYADIKDNYPSAYEVTADNRGYSQEYWNLALPSGGTGQGIFAFTGAYMDAQNAVYTTGKAATVRFWWLCSALLALFLLAIGYLVYAAGRRVDGTGEVRLLFIDGMYTEFTVAILILTIFFVCACAEAMAMRRMNFQLLFTWFVVSASVCLVFFLSFVRHIKGKTLFKRTLVCALLRAVARPFQKIYRAGTPMVKTAVAVLLLGLLTMIPFVGILTVPLALWLAYGQVKGYQLVRDGAARVQSGVYGEPIPVDGTGEMAALAASLNDIAAGLGREVERRLKSERLKTELIVNVSHDIRTPLTSVITYVDLLQKEDIPGEDARKYLGVIADKAARLKTLTDDLFEAAKAASGSVNVKTERLDIGDFITQGLGELDDKIKASALDFRVNLPEQKVFALADGRLLWRVLENLLSNVFKYSLPESRVYLSLLEEENRVVVSLKNISAHPLNMPVEELTERFTRGDVSRSSEGSGLGLDIAKSLMLCQGGVLNLDIDGDLFKATLRIPKAEPAEF